MSKITVCFIASNLRKFWFPFEPVLEQALKIGPVIVNVDLDSQDDTLNCIRKFEYVKTIEHHWGPSEGAGKGWLRNQKQAAVDAAETEFVLYLDIDELFSEKGVEWIRKIIEANLLGFNGVKFAYYHFYGDLNHYIPASAAGAWATKIVRLARMPVKFIPGSDGFGLEKHSMEVMNSPHRIYHYSHVRPRKEWHKKNTMMFARYNKDYDPIEIDWEMLEKFEGKHPDVIKKYSHLFEPGEE